MATPRKKNKIRDYDKTRTRLLEVVGEILRETGYTGLKTNNIARRLGKDKNLIRYYFNSLLNLERTYVQENDYWFAFFERFNLPDEPAKEQVRQLFIELMKENFNFFSENAEMQKIILWQISERNPLMRSVSDHREIEGDKLLKMTDPYFNGSVVNFRAIIAIILGAIYYMVLHAETNGSTVCGIDINREKDREIMLQAIEQVITWAWDAVDGRFLNKKTGEETDKEMEVLEEHFVQFQSSYLSYMQKDIPVETTDAENLQQQKAVLDTLETKLAGMLEDVRRRKLSHSEST
jgi:AcrR family transcriptional regulator